MIFCFSNDQWLRKVLVLPLFALFFCFNSNSHARELSLYEQQFYYEVAYEVGLYLSGPKIIKKVTKEKGQGRQHLPYQALDDKVRSWLHPSPYEVKPTRFEERLNHTSDFLNYSLAGYTAIGLPFYVPEGHRLGAVMTAVHGLETWYFTNTLLRKMIARYRPKLHYRENADLTKGKMDSHPSGHAGEAFAWATTASLLFELPGSWQAGLYGVATLSSLVRIPGGQHYFSDIIFGALLGSTIPWLTYSFLHGKKSKEPKDSAAYEDKWQVNFAANRVTLSYDF